MQVEATYDAGRLVFSLPLRLKRDHIRVLVEVPDDAVDLTPSYEGLASEVLLIASAERKRMDDIRTTPLPSDDDLPELTSETDDRCRAFTLRAELRREQGRAD